MRVLHVHRVTGVGGSERHLLALLPALEALGVEASLLVLEGPGAAAFHDAAARSGVRVLSVPSTGMVDPGVAVRIGRVLGRERPDLVHTHLMHADVYGQLAARARRVPSVSSVHSTFFGYHRQPYVTAARAAGRLAARTIAISEHVGRTLVEARIVPAERLRVVRYGLGAEVGQVSRERREAASALLVDGRVNVVVASRLVPHKGHDLLLRAFAEARRDVPDLALLIAGDGPLRDDLEAAAAATGVTEHVRFLGFVPDAVALMALADVVVFPTQPAFGEGFGLVNLEAMLVGRPVIGTATASIPEIVVAGETGLLVAPGDVSALAGALARLGTDADLRAGMGERGRLRATTEFTLQRMAEQTRRVYEEVLSARVA